MGAAGSCTGNDAQPPPRSVYAASSPTSSLSSKYSANRQIVAMPSARPPPKPAPPADGDTDGAFEPGKVQNLAFIKSVNAVDTRRDYSIIVDRSGSMAGDRWREAQAAVEFLVPHVCRCDPDGISLYFFNGSYEKFENIATPEEVMEKFQEYEPGGGTKLSKVLDDAVKPDSYERDGTRRPETILVITDGAPTDKQKVEEVIIRATFQYMERDEDLSITFMQIGNDEAATVWLTKLDDDLEAAGAQFDAVDTLTWADAKGTSFEELIRLSIYD